MKWKEILSLKRLRPLSAVLLLACSLLVSPPANAMTSTNLPACNAQLSWDWLSAIKSVSPTFAHFDPNEPGLHLAFNDSTNYINGHVDREVILEAFYPRADNSDYMTFKHDSQYVGTNWEYYLEAKGDTERSFRAVLRPDHSATISLWTSNTPLQDPTLTCVEYAHNVTYSADWTTHYSDVPSATAPTCSPLDFVCWLTPLFTGIGDGFNGVIQALTQGIATLFVPAEDVFSNSFSTLGTFFQSKFGFLIWPITFISSFLNVIVSDGNVDTCIYNVGAYDACAPSFSAPGGIIPGFTIDFGTIQTHWPSLWTYIQTSLVGITVFSLVFAIYHKYMRIIKS